jgi:hypothetical protein
VRTKFCDVAPSTCAHSAPAELQRIHWKLTLSAAGLKSQLWACRVSPDCGSAESPGSGTEIDAVADWVAPGSLAGFAVNGLVIALLAVTRPKVGKSFSPVTTTRKPYLVTESGTT